MNKDDIYIKLLIDKCLNIKNNKSLFICYEKALNDEFVQKIVSYVQNKGINDIYLFDEASYKKHEIMKNKTIIEIETESIFNNSVWDEYALKDAAFLMIESEIPHLMDDIDSNKIAKVKEISRNTKPIYLEKQLVDDIDWCICAYPNNLWANELFKNDPNAYQKLYNYIMSMCMCDKDDPISAWNNYLLETKNRVDTLNNLSIKSLHYTNSLGTDLHIYLPENVIWSSAYNKKGNIVNMPSYEVFTTPNTYKTEGIVYSSKPLIYNGVEISDFYLEFSSGKVINYDAKKGKNILETIINFDDDSNMLGECALVNYNSPISNTKLVFKTTLFDENASCHLALGTGFFECIMDNENYSKEDLYSMGVNKSKMHVDFMIGTHDLQIEAETNKGTILIFKNGNFVL